MGELGFGTMRLPVDAQGNIDYSLLSNMIDIYLSNGFMYFDTAYGYMGKRSEQALKKCLTERYTRDRYIIADKITLSKLGAFESLESFFLTQLENLGVDYIDVYLVHGLDNEKYMEAKRRHVFEFIKKLKEDGKVKSIGISFHDKPDVLENILSEQKEVDYVQLQVNYIDWKDEIVQSEKCLNIACAYNKRITIMEPLKGGLLASFKEMDSSIISKLDEAMSPASWGLRFAASQKNVDYVLSGMNTVQQMSDNISYMKDFKPLSNDEEGILLEVAAEYKKKRYIQCTSCKYCMDLCPTGIEIPIYLQLLNNINRTERKSVLYNTRTYYESYSKKGNGPNCCINCGRCESICPQKLSIRDYLKEVRGLLEEK